LEAQGLGEHAKVFESNGIDLLALLHVTDADLASLGIPLGHRRRIQAALDEAEAPAAPQSAERR
jgi:hypothetical protein